MAKITYDEALAAEVQLHQKILDVLGVLRVLRARCAKSRCEHTRALAANFGPYCLIEEALKFALGRIAEPIDLGAALKAARVSATAGLESAQNQEEPNEKV